MLILLLLTWLTACTKTELVKVKVPSPYPVPQWLKIDEQDYYYPPYRVGSNNSYNDIIIGLSQQLQFCESAKSSIIDTVNNPEG